MALNIKPLFGPHDPFVHPEVSYPNEANRLKASVSGDSEDLLRERNNPPEKKGLLKRLEEMRRKLDII